MTPPNDYSVGAAASGGWLLDENDNLRIRSWGSLAGVVVTIVARIARPDGAITTHSFDHVPASDRSAVTSTHRLGAGVLLSASAFASTGAPRRGQVFIQAQIIRGLTGAVFPLGTILQGYVTDVQDLAYPGSPIHASVEGAGFIRSLTGTDPAANTEIQETVPANARWRLIAMTFALVTDATAANREVAVTIDDGTTVLARAASGQNQAASLTRTYTAGPIGSSPAFATSPTGAIALAPVVLMDGYRLNTVTTNRQAGDNYGAPQLSVEEWIEV